MQNKASVGEWRGASAYTGSHKAIGVLDCTRPIVNPCINSPFGQSAAAACFS